MKKKKPVSKKAKLKQKTYTLTGTASEQTTNLKSTPTKETILEEAQRITSKDRNSQYDAPENNFARIADYWNVYLSHKRDIAGFNQDLNQKDIAMMMTLMKIAREDFQHIRDNLTDACGYLRCASKIVGDESCVENTVGSL